MPILISIDTAKPDVVAHHREEEHAVDLQPLLEQVASSGECRSKH